MKKKIFIIAEIGNNHEGNLITAKKLIREAYLSGVDAVKFQVFQTKKYIHHDNLDRFRMLKKFEFSQNDFMRLKNYAESFNLKFFASPFDDNSLEFLIKNTSIIKIASSENKNFHWMNQILSKNKKCIISTGLLNENEVVEIYKYLIKKFNKKYIQERVSFLHCVSSYPAKYSDLNLSVISKFKNLFNLKIGYSDHSIGTEACEIAMCLGADIIEKHFTLDKNFSNFRDHALSADPQEMKIIVEKSKKIFSMMGSSSKRLQISEKKNINSFRRSFYLTKNVQKNDQITLDDLLYLRPYKKNSFHYKNIQNLLKKKYWRNFKEGEVFKK